MVRNISLWLTLSLSASMAIGWSAGAGARTPCEREFLSKKAIYLPHRATATTLGRPLSAPQIACGFSGQWATKTQAINEALRQCELWARKSKYRKGECRIRDAL